MANFQIIITTSLKEYKILYSNKQALYQLYPRLDSFLEIRLGKNFEVVFAKPNLITEQKVRVALSWSVYKGDEDITAWTEADSEKREIGRKQLLNLKQFIQNLNNSANEEDTEWSQLLNNCIQSISEDDLFIHKNKIIITGWGLQPKSSYKKPPFFSDENLPLPEDENTSIIDKDDEYEEKEIDNQPYEPKESDDSSVYKDILSTDDINDEGSHDDNLAQRESESDNNELERNKKEIKNQGSLIDYWNRYKFWLFLLILLLVILFLWKGCSTNKGTSLLPPQPGIIIPIDTNKIVSDPDSIKKIVGDRLNIILKGERKDVVEFSKKFKEVYKEDEFKIIYYDTATSRLQIQIPTEKREQLIKEIPQKLDEFDMLIWHESIFERNTIPNDPAFSDNSKSWYFDAIEIEQAWKKSYGSKQVTVAIIDDGFDIQHKEFAGKIVKPWNVVNRDKNVLTNKSSKHGSHVAGTAVGNRNNGLGLAGIAPDCKLMPILVADANGIMTTTAIVDAVLYAINQGADIINLSLGMQIDPRVATYPIGVQKDIIKNSYLAEQYFWEDILSIAEEENVLVVMAGGNDNVLIGLDPMQRSPYAVKVSAVGHNLSKAVFSNYGENSTLSAPGVGIYSSIPNNQFMYMDGTSMAAPIITGAAALIKSINPDLKVNEIRNLMINTGRPLSPNIGPLLQLGTALKNIDDETVTSDPDKVDCSKIQLKIDSLFREIE